MFGWFGKKTPVVQETAPAIEAIPEVSPSEALRAKITEAQEELAKIEGVLKGEKAGLKVHTDELHALELREAGLIEAINVGQETVRQNLPNSEKIAVYLKQAKKELAENRTAQSVVKVKIDSINSFIESVEDQRLYLDDIVRHRDQRLSALQMREMALKAQEKIAEVDNNIDDYRRHVYTEEARHELSTGII